MPKNSQVKKRKKNCVLVRCRPRSGETTNRKCLFASIFLNVNCERGEVKRDGRSLRLSESHPQSYCSLEKSDAKHSLKPIYVFVRPPPGGINLATPRVLVTLVSVTVFVSVCCVRKGYKRNLFKKKKKKERKKERKRNSCYSVW